MWGDHLSASLRGPHHIYNPVRSDIGDIGDIIGVQEKVNNWEYCEKKVTPFVCLCNGSTHFFFLILIADALCDFFFADCETYNFIP